MLTGVLTETECAAIEASLDGLDRGRRVVVAMSGGVDSSVVAGVLVHLGYDVVGVTLQLYDHGEATQRKGACCAGQDIHDARSVAAHLGIPHYVLDYETRFREAVIDAFADSYLAGETPVPCVACNQTVKFGDLAAAARELGAAAMATGHYVRWRRVNGHAVLSRAHDGDRDQSYFLFATRADDLEFLRFPLGGIGKDAVRRIAQSLGLQVAAKPDSQDICFVPSGRYSDVIERLKPGAGEPGEIVHIDGHTLGRHKGIVHFTIGQRRGLGIAGGEPLFVVGLDPEAKRVIVGPREALKVTELVIRDLNWLGEKPPEASSAGNGPVFARVRSTQTPRDAILQLQSGRALVELPGGELGVAPGQACVLYDGAGGDARLLGGGWIAEAMNDGMRRHVTASLEGVIG